jgi:hypothetical protein
MKKSLVTLVVLVSCLAFAGTVCATSWWCYEMPTCKPVCKDTVFCKGQAKGIEKLCGPCAPVIKWKGKWSTVAVCPGSKAPKMAKMMKKVKKAKKK